MKAPDSNHPADKSAIPPRLHRALVELGRARLSVPVPAARDDLILRLAGEHLAVVRSGQQGAGAGSDRKAVLAWGGILRLPFQWSAWQRAFAWSGTFAALLLGLFIWRCGLPPSGERVAQDVDGDGKVDIVDALVLAQRVQGGRSQNPIFDFNGDGQVDAGDVRQIVARAVALNTGGTD